MICPLLLVVTFIMLLIINRAVEKLINKYVPSKKEPVKKIKIKDL